MKVSVYIDKHGIASLNARRRDSIRHQPISEAE